MPTSRKSRISRLSAIAGKLRSNWTAETRRSLGQFASSLTLKLIALVGIFAALPIILYGEFEKADRQIRNLVAESLHHKGWLTVQALAPILDQNHDLSGPALNQVLSGLAEDGTLLRLMFRPAAKAASDNFFFMASAPSLSPQQTAADLDLLRDRGILKQLAESCSFDKPVEDRYRTAVGQEEILTSVIPMNGRQGCWVLVSATNSSAFLNTTFGRPYWQANEVRMAALIYIFFAILAVLITLNVRRNLRHFRTVAREIRRGGIGAMSFASHKILPELAPAAADFDQLVEDLHRIAFDIRRTAEDNAHTVKAPLAVIRSALQPLRRIVPEGDHRATRSLELIDSALNRLVSLVSTAQRMGNETADFIEAPRLRINLTNVLGEGLRNARDISAEKQIRFVRHLDPNVFVLAPEGILDVVIENILDNAVSFSPQNGTISTVLVRAARLVELRIEDEGPGIDPQRIERIFDRNYSSRPQEHAEEGVPSHAGLGLWIARRYTDALGGRITVANRAGGGLMVKILLPVIG